MCGATLIQREDDKAEIVENRLKVYHENTEPLIAFYAAKGLLRTVSSDGPIEEVSKEIFRTIES